MTNEQERKEKDLREFYLQKKIDAFYGKTALLFLGTILIKKVSR